MEVQLSGENLYENREKKLKKYKEIALDEKNDWVQCYDKHDILVYSSEVIIFIFFSNQTI